MYIITLFLGYFKNTSNLLIIPAFNILNSIFKMKDDPLSLQGKLSFWNGESVYDFYHTAACESHRHAED